MSLHKCLGVSRSTIDDWVRLREQTGAVLPQKSKPSPRRAIPDLIAFEAFALHHPHATLAQMAAAWQRETGLHLSLMAFSRALRRIGWTRKKRVFSIRSATPPSERTFKNN